MERYLDVFILTKSNMEWKMLDDNTTLIVLVAGSATVALCTLAYLRSGRRSECSKMTTNAATQTPNKRDIVSEFSSTVFIITYQILLMRLLA